MYFTIPIQQPFHKPYSLIINKVSFRIADLKPLKVVKKWLVDEFSPLKSWSYTKKD